MFGPWRIYSILPFIHLSIIFPLVPSSCKKFNILILSGHHLTHSCEIARDSQRPLSVAAFFGHAIFGVLYL